MKAISAQWFETKVRYEKMMDDGQQKKVTESYVVDALSFTEAEASVIEEVSQYISGEFDVADIKKASYGEVFLSENDNEDRFFKAKLQFITIDEKTEKEKRTNSYKLVQASTFQQAVSHIEEVMSGSMVDYVIASLAETQIMDVYLHNKISHRDDKPEYENQ